VKTLQFFILYLKKLLLHFKTSGHLTFIVKCLNGGYQYKGERIAVNNSIAEFYILCCVLQIVDDKLLFPGKYPFKIMPKL